METDEERYKRIFTTEFIKTQFHGHSEAYAEKYASVYAEIFCIAYNVKCKSESQEYAEQYAKYILIYLHQGIWKNGGED